MASEPSGMCKLFFPWAHFFILCGTHFFALEPCTTLTASTIVVAGPME